MADDRIAVFDVEGVPPLDGTTVRVRPGVTVLGEGAPKRRSLLLQLLRIGLGSDGGDLPDVVGGKDEGTVERATVRLKLAGASYERTVERADGEVAVTGPRFLADPELAELYAFVLDTSDGGGPITNEAVLRDVVFRPTAIEDHREQVEQLQDDIAAVNQRLATVDVSEADLSSLNDRRESLEGHVETIDDRLERKEADIEKLVGDGNGGPDATAGLEIGDGEMDHTREEIRDVRYEAQTAYEGLASLHAEHRSLRNELRHHSEGADESVEDHAAAVSDLRRERERLQRSIRTLQDVIDLASGLLDRDRSGELAEKLADAHGDGHGSVEASGDDLVCWLCGSTIEPGGVEDAVETLETIRSATMAEVDEVEAKLETRQRERNRERRTEDRRRELEGTIADVEAEIERRRETLRALRRRRASLIADVETFQEDLRSLELEGRERLTLERDANRLTLEGHRAATNWEEVMERTIRLHEDLETRDALCAERDRKGARRDRLLAEIDRIEGEVVDRFNEEISAVLDAIDPNAIEDVRVERRTDGANRPDPDLDRGPDRYSDRARPELYVTPDAKTEDGGVPVDAVGGRRRDVAALVIRLAGYLVHDVEENVPFVLVEPPDGLADEAVARLIDYLSGVPEYLVVSVPRSLDRDATGDYHRVRNV